MERIRETTTEIAKLERISSNRNLVRASTTKRAQVRRKQLDKWIGLTEPQGDEKSVLTFAFSKQKKKAEIVILSLTHAHSATKSASDVCLSN